MKYDISPMGVCPAKIEFELDNNIVRNVRFTGGCNGNLKAISTLVDGMTIDQIREKLLGITCGFKSTSCSDQLAQAVLRAAEIENTSK